MPTKKSESEDSMSISLQINSTITHSDKRKFINIVLSEVSLSESNAAFLELEESFLLNFIEMFTNQNTITLNLDNVATRMATKKYLFSLSFVQDLYMNIEKQIIHKTASKESIETLNVIMHKAIDALNLAMKYLDKNGTKLSKVLTSKNIDKFLDKLLNSPTVNEGDFLNDVKSTVTQLKIKNAKEKYNELVD